MRADELDYDLPEELVAQAPLAARDGARLLSLASRQRGADAPSHRMIVDLPELVPPALWVLNDTRVIPARVYGKRPSGGRVELLLVERLASDNDSQGDSRAVPAEASGTRSREEVWLCMARANKPLQVGAMVEFPEGLTGEVLRLEQDGMRRVRLRADEGVERVLGRVGEMPLPPYIRRRPDASDSERYQTVFARQAGAVAAPTAGLHLTTELLERLRAAGHRFSHVTLHVGPGTFAPLRSERLTDHSMHAERYEVPAETAEAIAVARREARPILAVGTTVVRTLEAAADGAGHVRAGAGRTDIFIYPPFRFSVVDLLLTNFHLPRSTLLALVMAFGGIEHVRAAYAEAVRARYRFFSYGDAMLLPRAEA